MALNAYSKVGKPLTVLTSLKKGGSIKLMLHKALAGWESPRPHGTIHASELLRSEREFCPKEWAFLDMGIGLEGRRDSYIGTALRVTFDHGRDMERRLRNEWLRPHVIGYWECGVCSFEYPVFGKAPKGACKHCGWGHQWNYKETRLTSAITGVSGGIDAFINVGAPLATILEIKSIDKDMFRDLKAPLAEHKLRTSLYLRLAAESSAPIAARVNKQKASILYVSKSYGFQDFSMKEAGIPDAPFSPFKEYSVLRDDSLTDYDMSKAKALTLWRKLHKEGENGLPCGVCHNGLTKRAQQCSVVGPCFSGNYLSTITWLDKGYPKHPGKPIVA